MLFHWETIACKWPTARCSSSEVEVAAGCGNCQLMGMTKFTTLGWV